MKLCRGKKHFMLSQSCSLFWDMSKNYRDIPQFGSIDLANSEAFKYISLAFVAPLKSKKLICPKPDRYF
jgi:hypothetical protein